MVIYPQLYRRPRIYRNNNSISINTLINDIINSQDKLWVIIPKNRFTNPIGFGCELGIKLSRRHQILPIFIKDTPPENLINELNKKTNELKEEAGDIVSRLNKIVIYYTQGNWITQLNHLLNAINNINQKIIIISTKKIKRSKLGKINQLVFIENNIPIIELSFTLIMLAAIIIGDIISFIKHSELLIPPENKSIYIILLMLNIIVLLPLIIGKTIEFIHGLKIIKILISRLARKISKTPQQGEKRNDHNSR